MKFFKKFFKLEDVSPMSNGEYAVCCPFPHKDSNGNDYYETRASAHINPNKSVFHCKVCDLGLSEASFLSKIEGISYKDALVTLNMMEKSDLSDWSLRVQNLKNSPPTMELVRKLGIESVIDTLQLGFSGAGIDFPVFMYGDLIDVRTYNPEGHPKVKGRLGGKNMIIPFDLWRDDKRDTILAAGEKDMAIFRAYGFNAITFTGGEQSFPKLFKASFRGRKVYIVYDNDDAGREGAKKAAHFLCEAGAIPYIVTGHYNVCIGKGEDAWDFFMKYGKTAEDMNRILNETPEVTEQEIEEVKNDTIPLVKLNESANGKYANTRFIRSKVTVLSIYEDMFNVPEYVQLEKTIDDEKSVLMKGDTVEWVLDNQNIQDVLYLMDNRITKEKRDEYLRKLAGLDSKEKGLKQSIMSSVQVHKAYVTDEIDTSETKGDGFVASELLVYSIGTKLQAGKKYEITYKPVSHPLDGMRIVGVVTDVVETSSSIENFKITEGVKESLRCFQQKEWETVTDKMNEFFERSKGFIGVEARKVVTWATDMFFHTPLEFKFGRRTERAYLDVMIIGDPRTMKSQTAKKMREMYELGTVTSLKTATTAGLIGGSDKVAGGGYKTKVGLIPQCHKGAIIMEEFSGGGRDLVSQLTEIRSSNRVRITRVNGHTDIPAMVRMLSISNPATKNGGVSLALNQYPCGINVILDLVGASEDIARYDFFLLVDEPEGYTNPLDHFDLEPFSKEAYMNRIRWIWSRSAEQVQIDRSVAEYIVKCADWLNKEYDCHIKLFGAEAWKKLARVAISIAGQLVSTDEDFEKIIVKEEHVSFAASFLRSLYDNPLFKLKHYVDNERAYNMCREVDIHALQNLYANHSAVLEEMEISTDMSQKQLQLVSGLDSKEFATFVSKLGASKFIKWQGEKIIPTGKFRKAMRKINRQVYLATASERG